MLSANSDNYQPGNISVMPVEVEEVMIIEEAVKGFTRDSDVYKDSYIEGAYNQYNQSGINNNQPTSFLCLNKPQEYEDPEQHLICSDQKSSRLTFNREVINIRPASEYTPVKESREASQFKIDQDDQ